MIRNDSLHTKTCIWFNEFDRQTVITKVGSVMISQVIPAPWILIMVSCRNCKLATPTISIMHLWRAVVEFMQSNSRMKYWTGLLDCGKSERKITGDISRPVVQRGTSMAYSSGIISTSISTPLYLCLIMLNDA